MPGGTILIATRPEPVGRWLVEKQRSSSKEEISIKGSVRGHGKVGIDITGAHNLDGRPQNKRLFSQIVTLPADGGEKNFEARFTLYTGWSWNMLLANKGIFAGYCSTESQQLVNAKRQADEVKQMAEQALANSNTAVDLASDR